MMKVTLRMAAVLLVVGSAIVGCGDDDEDSPADLRGLVEVKLAAFADELVEDRPPAAELGARIRAYLEDNPEFFGSTVALIGEDGKVSTSPYVYRLNGGLAEVELAYPEYDIDHQDWLVRPRDGKQPVWSEPYFDDGGGNIWMVTRSVPLLENGEVYAVATTDLPIDPP